MRDYEGMILDQEMVARHPEMAGFTRTNEDDWRAAGDTRYADDEDYNEDAQAAVEAAYARSR